MATHATTSVSRRPNPQSALCDIPRCTPDAVNPGHNWATSVREREVKRAISSQPRPLRINTGYNSDMTGSHEVVGSIPTRSTSNPLKTHDLLPQAFERNELSPSKMAL